MLMEISVPLVPVHYRDQRAQSASITSRVQASYHSVEITARMESGYTASERERTRYTARTNQYVKYRLIEVTASLGM